MDSNGEVEQSEAEDEPLKERLLPQTSVRFLMILIALSALVMMTIRMSAESTAFWSKVAVLLLGTTVGCFLFYAALFLIANALTATTEPILSGGSAESDSPDLESNREPQRSDT